MMAVVTMVMVVTMVVVVVMVLMVEQIVQKTSDETSRKTWQQTEHRYSPLSLGVPAPASCRRSGAC
jgi:ABC-type cobalt transport system substrate-binding protein